MPEINQKQKKAFEDIEQLNKLGPIEALKAGVGLGSSPEVEAKKQILRKLSEQNKPSIPQIPVSEQERELMRTKGADTFQRIKDDEARKNIQRLKEEADMQETLMQFGDPDAAQQLQLKKDALKKLYGI